MDKLQVLCNLVLSVSRKLCRYRPLNNVSGAFKNTIIRYGFATSRPTFVYNDHFVRNRNKFPTRRFASGGKIKRTSYMYVFTTLYVYISVRMIFKPRAHFGHSFGCPTKPFKIITRLNAHQ